MDHQGGRIEMLDLFGEETPALKQKKTRRRGWKVGHQRSFTEAGHVSLVAAHRERFIANSKKLFPDLFDYSLVAEDFTSQHGKVRLTCILHQFCFSVSPAVHKKSPGGGCEICNPIGKGRKSSKHKPYQGLRYTEAGLEKKRQANLQRWLAEAADKHELGQFDYSLTDWSYQRQKLPVWLICNEYQICFQATPLNHTRSDGGGCPVCGPMGRGAIKFAVHHAQFLDFFEAEHSHRLIMLSDYTGIKERINFRCRLHRTEKKVMADAMLNSGNLGCDQCFREQASARRLHSDERIRADIEPILPPHIKLLAVLRRKGFQGSKSGDLKMECQHHGVYIAAKSYIQRSGHKCPECGDEQGAYTGTRLQTLVHAKRLGKPAEIGVITVEVFGIRAIKVGFTSRSLEDRYVWSLREVHARMPLPELHAILVETVLHRRFRPYQDERIMNAGIAGGNRWNGDTELYHLDHLPEILCVATEYGAQQACKSINFDTIEEEYGIRFPPRSQHLWLR
jgi:hypothetical protein